MERKIVKVNDNEYEFINNAWENSRNWGHESTLLKNGVEIGHNRVVYINRTWENYRFQSCMLGITWQLIHDREEELKEEFKENKNISRLTKKYEEEFNKYLDADALLTEYKEVRSQIRGNVW